jgi:hypothetical protein
LYPARDPCEDHATEPTRAPANAVELAVTAMATAVPDDAVALARALARAARRRRWQSRAARRGARLLGCLRRLRRDLSFRFAGMRKVDHAWQVLAHDGGCVVEAAVVTCPRVHKELDFALPIQVLLLRPDLLRR